MAQGKLPTGIELHGNTIRITFSYRGKRYREPLKGLGITAANIKFAAGQRAAILHEISAGTFSFIQHFPDSKNARLFSHSQNSERTVAEAVDNWLTAKQIRVARSTFSAYRSKAETHIKPAFGHRLISEITKTDIDKWIAVDLSKLKNKTINEVMIVMRGVMKDARADRIITEAPTDYIDNLKVHREEPDPFTRDEINRIVTTATQRTSEVNMMEFAIWTGLRISELIALCWEDVDLEREIIKVQRANVKSHYKTTKTQKSKREVELIAPAIQALKRQMAYSYALPPVQFEVTQDDNRTTTIETLRPVFVNSQSMQPHANDAMVRQRFWITHLRKAKVRYRGPNHARHTYASQLLSTGEISKDWIAKQMGHTSTKMLDMHYAKWIPEDAPPMAKIVNRVLGFNNSMPEQNPKSSSAIF